MRCEDAALLLDECLEGLLSEELRTRVERHLLRCSACASELKGLEQTRTLLRDALPRREASPAFRERAAARLEDALQDVLCREPGPAETQWELPFLRDA